MKTAEQKAATVRARRGARWLDENFPKWEKRINVKTLQLNTGDSCICGQVFKKKAKEEGYPEGYEYALDHLFAEANSWLTTIVGPVDVEKYDRNLSVALALGFFNGCVTSSTVPSDQEYVSFFALQEAWVNLLAKRAKKEKTS
jgi:hypothetical protein